MRYLHTMVRIAHLDSALHFYRDILGMFYRDILGMFYRDILGMKEVRRHDQPPTARRPHGLCALARQHLVRVPAERQQAARAGGTVEPHAEHRQLVGSTSLRPLVALMLCLIVAGCATQSPPPETDPDAVTFTTLDLAIYEAGRRLDAREYERADSMYDGVLAHPDFKNLEPRRVAAVLYFAGRAAIGSKHPAKALALLKRSTGTEWADFDDWNQRLIAAVMLPDWVDATLDLLTIVQRWPDRVASVNEDIVFDTIWGADKSAESRPNRKLLLEGLFDLHWTGIEGEPSWPWYDYALILIDAGDLARARDVVGRITRGDALIAIRMDRRFDPLGSAIPTHAQIRTALDKEVEDARTGVADHSDQLSRVVVLAQALMHGAHFDEVLGLTSPFAEDLPSTSNVVLQYKDWRQQASWVLNWRARALEALGRGDEAEQVLRRAARNNEGGQPNVNQAINLALLLIRMGRSEEALSAIAILGEANSRGHTLVELVRLEAAVMQKDDTARDRSLKYLRENSKGAYQTALLACDRIDEAAAIMIARLKDPDSRFSALRDMQQYYQVPTLSPFYGTIRAAQDIITSRADVRAAAEKVGRIESYPYFYDHP